MNRKNDYECIRIQRLEVFAKHGVRKEENILGQKFYVSVAMYLDTTSAAKQNDLGKTVNYSDVCDFIYTEMTEHTFLLIESVADYLAEGILKKFTDVKEVEVEISKPNAPVALHFENVSVTEKRGWKRVYLSLGSNLGDKKGYLDTAKKKIEESPACRLTKMSSYLETEPYGYTDQDTFLNACAEVWTYLKPYELLDFIHQIELEAKRERKIHWGPRTLDIDILLYEDYIMQEDTLILPHCDMHKRYFVLKPLSEIAPYVIHPVYQKNILDLLRELNYTDL